MTEVACNGCTACCRNNLIALLPDDGDDVESYVREPMRASNGIIVGYHIPQKPDGSCHYLRAGACSIYARRPAVCRTFDCRKWFLSFEREQRRELFGNGGIEDAARRRIDTLSPQERAEALAVRAARASNEYRKVAP